MNSLAVMLALGLGIPIYLTLLPHSPALGAIILGGLLLGIPRAFKDSRENARRRAMSDHPSQWGR